MNTEIVDRYNSLFKLLSIPIEAIDGTRIVYKQKGKTITKGLMLAKLQRKGILFLDTIHGENSHYKNKYTRYPVKNGEIVKGTTVRFHENVATVSGLAEKRRHVVIAIRVEGLSFDIEVDPRKIDIGTGTAPEAKVHPSPPDCSSIEKELESARQRLQTATTELEECRSKRDTLLSRLQQHVDAEEPQEDIIEEPQEIQAEPETNATGIDKRLRELQEILMSAIQNKQNQQ